MNRQNNINVIQAMIENQSIYRIIVEHMTEMVRIVDVSGRCAYASPSHQKLLGYTVEQYINQQIFDNIVHPEDLQTVTRDFMEIVESKRTRRSQYRAFHAGGHVIHLEDQGTPVMNDVGEIQFILIVSRDVTEKKLAEQALVESESKYRLITENMSDIITVLDVNGMIRYCSKTTLGIDQRSLPGTSGFEYVHPDHLAHTRKQFIQIIQSKTNRPLQTRFIHLDGFPIDVECVCTPVLDSNGEVERMIVASRDISDKVRIEKELRESEERYRRLVELSPLAIAVYKGNKIIYVNPAGVEAVGADGPNDIIGTPLMDWIHPTERDLVQERMKHTVFNGYSSNGECKIMRIDGETVDIKVASIYDAHTKSVQLVFMDITARKVVERALSESEELNRRLIELSPEAIAFHFDYKYHYVNPATLSLLGAEKIDDIIGRSVFDIIHPDYAETASLRLAKVYDQKSTTALVEQKVVRLDGNVIDVEVIATSVPYMGKHAGLTLVRDITARKKAEQERERAEKVVRESEELYFRLQTSLDHFSHDLFGVMHVSEMERLLVKEVQDIFRTTKVSIIKVNRNHDSSIKSGYPNIPKMILEHIERSSLGDLPLCEINDMTDGCFIKVGEIREQNYFLCIGEKTSCFNITSKQVWLKTICRYVSVIYDNFRVIEDLTQELQQIDTHQAAPSWLLRILFKLSENERKILSQDLHDSALQEQIIWYRKLDQLSGDRSVPQSVREQLYQITQGLLDVIYQIRITCSELRPPMLKEEGLVSSLETLFDFMQMRINYSIDFQAEGFGHTLNDDLLLGLYRIVQELLANATKHSNATQLRITLSGHTDRIQLNYEDNGFGIELDAAENTFHCMGIYGIKERVRSLDGNMDFQSSPNKGLAVFISIPCPES